MIHGLHANSFTNCSYTDTHYTGKIHAWLQQQKAVNVKPVKLIIGWFLENNQQPVTNLQHV